MSFREDSKAQKQDRYAVTLWGAPTTSVQRVEDAPCGISCGAYLCQWLSAGRLVGCRSSKQQKIFWWVWMLVARGRTWGSCCKLFVEDLWLWQKELLKGWLVLVHLVCSKMDAWLGWKIWLLTYMCIVHVFYYTYILQLYIVSIWMWIYIYIHTQYIYIYVYIYAQHVYLFLLEFDLPVGILLFFFKSWPDSWLQEVFSNSVTWYDLLAT